MSRSVPVPRPVPRRTALAFALLLSLTGCGDGGDEGGVRGAPGAPGLGDPYFPKAGNGGYDVEHYGLTLDYAPARRWLEGTAVVTARAGQDLSSFNLDLAGMKVERVTVNGRAARWSRAGQELTVRPPGGLREGAEFRTAVRYSGRPRTLTDPDGSEEGWLRTRDGALALGEPIGTMAWYPGNHHPSDKALLDLRITVPEGLRAVSNGELKGESTAKGRTAFSWSTAEPMATYVSTVAIGRYEVRTSAAAAEPRSYVAVDPDQADASRAVLARIPEVTEWAEGVFGPYPFASTGAIVERPGDSAYALETQNRPVFPGAPDIGLLVHELAHQWYGNSVTPRTWQDMWLNEGFATYAEWLWREEHGGPTAQETFDERYEEGEERGLWEFPPGAPPDARHISGDPVYERGAMVLHLVRRTAGDRAFRSLLRGWAAQHRHGNASTAEFTEYVERRVPGKDFSAIWRDWLYGEDRPERPR